MQGVRERVNGELALPGKAAVMAAPGKIVQVELGRVGDLNQENAVVRYGTHRIEIGAARQHVKAVKHQSDRRMIGAADDLPGVAIVADMPSPGERLEANTNAPFCRSLAEVAEVGRGAVNAAEAIGRHIAADHQQIAT